MGQGCTGSTLMYTNNNEEPSVAVTYPLKKETFCVLSLWIVLIIKILPFL